MASGGFLQIRYHTHQCGPPFLSVQSICVVMCSLAYNVPQSLVVIYWLSGLWPLGLIYPNIQTQILNSVKSSETHGDGVSSWYTGGIICRCGVCMAHLECPSDSAITDSSVQGTKSLCCHVPGGGMRARAPKSCTSVSPSGFLATDSKSPKFTAHNGFFMRHD